MAGQAVMGKEGTQVLHSLVTRACPPKAGRVCSPVP